MIKAIVLEANEAAPVNRLILLLLLLLLLPGYFTLHGELLVIVVFVHGRRRSGHFSPHGELSVIVVPVNGLVVAEPDGANHLAMMSQIRNQMPTPLLGHLIAVRLRLVAPGPLPLAHPTNATRTGCLWGTEMWP